MVIVRNLSEISASPLSHDQDIEKRVILSNGELPHITQFAQAVLKPGQRVTRHMHRDMNEVFMVSSGYAQMEINDRTFPITQGMIITVHAGEFHSIVNSAVDEDLVLVYFGVLDH